MQRISTWLRAEGAALALGAAMVIYLATLATIFHQHANVVSFAAHYVAQAQSWLHGQLDVPGWLGHDLVLLHGKWYIVYPPAPALLMVPFVALLGDRFSDIWFGWLVGGTNIALLYHLLQALAQAAWTRRTWRENVVIAVTFGSGTIALWLAIGGAVWFVAQTLVVTFTLLLLLGAVRRRWWLASLGLGALFLTRTPDALGAIVLGAAVLASLRPPSAPSEQRDIQGQSVFDHENHEGNASPKGLSIIRAVFRNLCVAFVPFAWPSCSRPRLRTSQQWGRIALALGLPFGIAVAIWLIHNQMYFGHPFSSGYDLQIQQDYPQIRYGLLNWRYVWPNFAVDFLNLPTFVFTSPYDLHPAIDWLSGGNGTSIFFTTPLFVLFFCPARSHLPPWARLALWVTVALLAIFTLFWNLTGYLQVGARYLFDVYPYLFVLLAARGGRITWRWLALAGAGADINLELAKAFWCRLVPLGHHSLHWLAFATLLLALPLLAIAAWWWLRMEGPAANSPVPSGESGSR
jgi:hypothetical protein